MRRLVLVAALAGACATAPPTPVIPPPTDLDALLPAEPKLPPIPADLPNGPTTGVDDGQCAGLPGGYWVSEYSYNVLLAKASELDKRRAEAAALRQLRVTERTEQGVREGAYKTALAGAERSARWRLWVGVAVGAGAVLLGAWTAGQVSR